MKRSASLNQTPRPVYSFDIELAFRSLLTVSFCFLFDRRLRSSASQSAQRSNSADFDNAERLKRRFLLPCSGTKASLGTISMILVRNKLLRACIVVLCDVKAPSGKLEPLYRLKSYWNTATRISRVLIARLKETRAGPVSSSSFPESFSLLKSSRSRCLRR